MIRIETPADIGETLALLRQLAGLTQQQLVAACGISQTEISLYELGDRVPRPAKLLRHLAGLGWGLAVVPLGEKGPETALSATESAEQGPEVDGEGVGGSNGCTGHTEAVALSGHPDAFAVQSPHPTCIDVTAIDQKPGSEWICGPECPKEA